MSASVPAAPLASPSSEWRNLFGVCAAIGADFGFDPLWLRIAFAVGLIANWHATLALYAALGAAVIVSRIVFPTRVSRARTARRAAA